MPCAVRVRMCMRGHACLVSMPKAVAHSAVCKPSAEYDERRSSGLRLCMCHRLQDRDQTKQQQVTATARTSSLVNMMVPAVEPSSEASVSIKRVAASRSVAVVSCRCRRSNAARKVGVAGSEGSPKADFRFYCDFYNQTLGTSGLQRPDVVLVGEDIQLLVRIQGRCTQAPGQSTPSALLIRR